MSLTLNEVSQVMVEGNKTAFKQGAKRRTGKMINKRVIAAITPRLPLMVRGYATTDLGEALIANTVAAALIKYMPTNERVTLAADAMITAAADDLIGSFNIEAMIDEVLDGIDLSSLKDKGEDVRESTGSVLRKAADIVEPTASAVGA